jgi:SAM-dependent methyltransferase
MYTGFPTELLRWVRCIDDDGPLESAPEGPHPAASIENGSVRCATCLRVYRVDRGILRLLDQRELDAESAHEAGLRDSIAQAGDYVEQFRSTWPLEQFDRMEMQPTLAALAPLRDRAILELGAGTGRYTVELVKSGGTTLAVDFSATSLERLAGKIEGSGTVGLVQADVTRLRVAPRAFDRVFSTLVSNLPTRAHRDAVYGVAADALRDDGAFVFSAHRYGIRQWVRGEPKEGRYSEGGIYRRLFTQRELLGEVSRFFDAPHGCPIQVAFPLTYRTGFPLLAVSRWAERLPVIKQLGFLLLITARRPARPGTSSSVPPAPGGTP